MTRLNVWLPDDLAEQARAADLNISALTRQAVTAELRRHATDEWLASLPAPRREVSHSAALDALDAARDEFGR